MYNPGCLVDHFLCTEQFLIGYRRIGTGMSGPGKQYLALSVLPTRPLKVFAGILPDRRPFCHPGFPSQMSRAITFEGLANKRGESRLHQAKTTMDTISASSKACQKPKNKQSRTVNSRDHALNETEIHVA